MPNCVSASVNKTFQDKCTDVSKFFLKPKIWFWSLTRLYIITSKDSDSEEPIEASWAKKVKVLLNNNGENSVHEIYIDIKKLTRIL